MQQQVPLQAQQAHVINIINLLADANIVDVDACMTRLRVTAAKDAGKSRNEEQWVPARLWVLS